MGMRPLYERQTPLKIALQDEWGPLQHRVRHALRGGSVLARDLGLLMVSCLRGAGGAAPAPLGAADGAAAPEATQSGRAPRRS